MEDRSNSIDDNNRLSQLIALRKKRMPEIQTLDEKIHASLDVFEIEEALVFSAYLNDRVLINIDTIKRFFEKINRDTESNNPETTSSTHVHGTTSSASRTNTRLPELNLPSFSGNYKQWTSFIDLFNSSVDSNSQLSNSEKSEYLKASLTKDAANLLSSLTITDSKYHTSLEVLKERYDNPRMIARAHVQSIFNLPKMRNNNGEDLRILVEGVAEHRISLQSLRLPFEQYDLLLNFLITERLDQETRRLQVENSFTWPRPTGL